MIFSSIFAKVTRTDFRVSPEKRILVFMRSIGATFALIFYIAALKLIPVLLATVLEGLAPFWSILIGSVTLGLKLNSLEWFGLFISFFGTVLIFQSARTQEGKDTESMNNPILGCTLAIIGSAFLGFICVLSRKL